MKTFIKVTEIWIPDKERTRLEFGSGLYGAFTEFKTASEYEHFAFDEGLPGKAWAAKRPIVMTRLEPSYFKRAKAAKKAGLTCGIALPIFSGEFLLAVVVFFCGDDEKHAGAIELWQNNPDDPQAVQVIDGYYGTLDYFENISRTLKLPKGEGLPGLAWASGMPVLLENIAANSEFIRSTDARQAGITTGLAIPFFDSDNGVYVMTFLSAKATPIAKRIQIWTPENDRLVCQTGYSKTSNELAVLFESLSVEKGNGALGRVWLTGMPLITGAIENASYNPELECLTSMLAIPVIEEGRLKAIVTFLF